MLQPRMSLFPSVLSSFCLLSRNQSLSVHVGIISADALAALQVTTKFFRCVSVLGLRKSEVRPVSVPDACHGWWPAQVFS
jgi:hypothetical protein